MNDASQYPRMPVLQMLDAMRAARGGTQPDLDAPTRSSFVPPSRSGETTELAKQQIAASLAAGMIAASGRPHTAEEAVAVWRGVLGVVYSG